MPHDGFVALSRDCDFDAGAGAVGGITMDERIRNLMRERGHQELLMNVDDPDLEPKLLAALGKLATRGRSDRRGIGRTVVQQSESHGPHGRVLRRRSPAPLSRIPHPQGEWSWEDYLPPMSTGLAAVDRSIQLEHEGPEPRRQASQLAKD